MKKPSIFAPHEKIHIPSIPSVSTPSSEKQKFPATVLDPVVQKFAPWTGCPHPLFGTGRVEDGGLSFLRELLHQHDAHLYDHRSASDRPLFRPDGCGFSKKIFTSRTGGRPRLAQSIQTLSFSESLRQQMPHLLGASGRLCRISALAKTFCGLCPCAPSKCGGMPGYL